jgi:serine/threonine-protein kinase
LTGWKVSAIAAAVVILSGWDAGASGWRTYHNPRFGVTAAYPAGWKMGPAPENNDGRVFSSPDGRARVTISGVFGLDPRAREMSIRAEPLEGEKVLYKEQKGDWIVLSGARGNAIFYRKSLLSCKDTIWNDVEIAYPAEEKAKYDPLIAHIAASLRPGSGYADDPRLS